jgi:hypothetical protein
MNNEYFLIDTCGWITLKSPNGATLIKPGATPQEFTPYFQQLPNRANCTNVSSTLNIKAGYKIRICINYLVIMT